MTAHGAHLVGSVPLASAETVFETLASELGDRLRRMPDGETGPRSDWIVWQLPVFTSQPRLEVVPPAPDGWRPLPRVRLEDGARAEDVRFEALGYADAAVASYRVFARLKRDGRVPVACRFQVCLPTPLAPISAFVVPEHQGALEPAYEARLLAELRLVVQEVPHDQLAIQWDTNFEFGMLEGVFPVWFDDVKGGILERLLRLSRQVPADVELGYHFCYGDVQHRHFTDPRDAAWPRPPVDTFGLRYATVELHGWYRSLDPTVEDLARHLDEGQILVDYSGGTGILLDRLKLRLFDRRVGMLIAHSSPKFLRVGLDKFGDDERVAFRLLRWLKEDKRLELLEEVLGPELVARGVDALASTNAIHLYLDLPQTLASWARVLRPGGRVFVQSGNIRNPSARPSEWILDETVWTIHEVATGLVRNDPRYAAYRPLLDDGARMRAHLAYRDRVFLPVRPLEYYVRGLEGAGFTVESVTARTIEVSVHDWIEFLTGCHEAVLGWVGGSAKVDGKAAGAPAVSARLALTRHPMDTLFGGRPAFRCCWTYINCVKP